MIKALEALQSIEEILEGDTLWDYDYYERKGLPLSWEVDRGTLIKIEEVLKQALNELEDVEPKTYGNETIGDLIVEIKQKWSEINILLNRLESNLHE